MSSYNWSQGREAIYEELRNVVVSSASIPMQQKLWKEKSTKVLSVPARELRRREEGRQDYIKLIFSWSKTCRAILKMQPWGIKVSSAIISPQNYDIIIIAKIGARCSKGFLPPQTFPWQFQFTVKKQQNMSFIRCLTEKKSNKTPVALTIAQGGLSHSPFYTTFTATHCTQCTFKMHENWDRRLSDYLEMILELFWVLTSSETFSAKQHT